jgi:hypothetical protein
MFNCSICGEESTKICVWCTKDTCSNHLCEKCGRCSDCCECQVPLDEPAYEPAHVHVMHPHPAPEPEPEPPHPPPDPDPFPEEPGVVFPDSGEPAVSAPVDHTAFHDE